MAVVASAHSGTGSGKRGRRKPRMSFGKVTKDIIFVIL